MIIGYLKISRADYPSWDAAQKEAYIGWTKTLRNPDGSLQMPQGDTSISSYTYTREDENPDYLWARVEHGKDGNEGFIEGDIRTESEAIALGMKPYPIPDIEAT